MKTGKGIAISGIWIGCGISCFATDDISGIVYATIVTLVMILAEPARRTENNEPQKKERRKLPRPTLSELTIADLGKHPARHLDKK